MAHPLFRLVLLQIAALLIFLNYPLGNAFKAHEFKKCSEAHFCKRNRDRSPGNCTFLLASGDLIDGRFVGNITNTAYQEALFSLQISAYDRGILRFKVDEISSVARFQVPYVLEPDFEKNWIPLHAAQDQKSSDSNFTLLRFENYLVKVRHNPIGLTVLENGEEILEINRKGLFNFEHQRGSKGEDDPPGLWSESFHSHSDSKPKGPVAISFDLTFFNTRHVYGIPERATSLSLKATHGPSISSEPYRLYNLDVFEYEHESPFGLYGSIPFMQSHSSKRTTGFFWLNSAEMWVDVKAPGWDGTPPEQSNQVDTHWIAESGVLDAFVTLGPSPKAVSEQYARVTGATRLPPLFAIAYHQCRWNYKDESDVFSVDASFDSHDIPYDVLWLDIEHTDGKKYMTWDSSLFPNPVEMQHKIASKGRHMITIVDPHMKRDDSYLLHKESAEKGYYVKDKNGNDFDGWCWPGSSSYLDMLSPEIRDWWADKFSYRNYIGSTSILHIWNDMNEPSVFNGPEVTMPKDNIHYGGVEHRDVHNAYGYYYHMATADGLLKRDNGRERPFVLSRAAYAGTQKVGAIWTGDNTADWNHLRVSVPMVLTLGISGIAFSGADVGGFFGNPDGELMTRWMQLGTFYPFFRAHAHLDTKRREPWLFGEPYTTHIKEAIRFRYALLPYIYTLFFEAYEFGTPVMRPLWMEFPNEESIFAHDESFMLGNSLLVHPIMQQGASSVVVTFPGTEAWYDAKTGAAYAIGEYARKVELSVQLETVPVFQRAGTVVPRKDRPRRSSSQMHLDPYTLVVALNSSQEAEGYLYTDDGHSYEFEKGNFIHRHFVFTQGHLYSKAKAPSSSSSPSSPSSSSSSKSTDDKGYETPCIVERIVFLGISEQAQSRIKKAIVESEKYREVIAETGYAFLRPGVQPKVLVLRSPNVRIKDDWTIRLVGF